MNLNLVSVIELCGHNMYMYKQAVTSETAF